MKTYEELLGVNLQRLRSEKGLSQSQLGDILGFSYKTISGWENGRGIPDVLTLYRLANFFGVKLDDFFAEDNKYYLGIDGGGTKTAFVLSDENLNILRQEKTEGCNPVDIGLENAMKCLKEGINTICQGISKSQISVFAGIAGSTATNNKAPLNNFFRDLGFYAYECDSDNRNIIAAGLGKKNGISMIMGTGVCAFRQKDGECKRFSGWGYLFDDGGSAYNVSRDAISAHFDSVDGIGKPTLISKYLMESYKDNQQLLGELYKGGKREIAGFAKLVYRAAREGDEIAVSIIKRNMNVAARIIESASRELTEEIIPVVLTGGLTVEADTLNYLSSELENPERFDIKVLDCPPVNGALILAKELAEKEDEKRKQ